jgi:hypothetical protein
MQLSPSNYFSPTKYTDYYLPAWVPVCPLSQIGSSSELAPISTPNRTELDLADRRRRRRRHEQ